MTIVAGLLHSTDWKASEVTGMNSRRYSYAI